MSRELDCLASFPELAVPHTQHTQELRALTQGAWHFRGVPRVRVPRVCPTLHRELTAIPPPVALLGWGPGEGPPDVGSGGKGLPSGHRYGPGAGGPGAQGLSARPADGTRIPAAPSSSTPSPSSFLREALHSLFLLQMNGYAWLWVLGVHL